MDFDFIWKIYLPVLLLIGLLIYALWRYLKSPKYKFKKAKRAADRGDIAAQVALGIFYYNGKVVKEDFQKAYMLFKNAANHNNLKAFNWLGHLYQNGFGVAENKNLAFKWFEKAAKQGDPEGQFNLGMCYIGLGGVERNERAGMDWLEKAAVQGNAAAANNLAVMVWEGGDNFEGDPLKAFQWYLILANQGEVHSQNIVGCYYLNGIGGFKKDPKIAFNWFKKSAKQKDPIAIAILGWLYQTGQGVKYHRNRSYRRYRSIRKYNIASVHFNRGLLIELDLDRWVRKRYWLCWEAAYYYRKAAAQGHAKAYYQWATLYERGYGFMQDLKKAIELYEKAADLNLDEARQRIDFLRKNGRNGTRMSHPILQQPDDLSKLVI